MSWEISILLVIGAIALFIFVMGNIRKAKMRIEDAIFWIVLALAILILAFIPQIAFAAAGFFHFQAPINFVFLAFIAILLVKCFMMSVRTSQLETKLRELTQQLAINALDAEDRTQAQDAACTGDASQSAQPGESA